MKTFSILLFLLFANTLIAQVTYECGMDQNYQEKYLQEFITSPPQIGGAYAPAKTLNGSYVRIFCVFAQFAGDTKDPNDTNWPLNEMPVWANTFIGTNPNQAPFPVNTISNYFYEMSNGQNIIIGYVHPSLVIVNAPSNQEYGTSNRAVLEQIDQTVDFSNYDKWDMHQQYSQTFNQTDSYVDAIYIIWRNIESATWGGKGALGNIGPISKPTDPFITNDVKIITSRVPTIGMTLNLGHRSDYTFQNKIALLAHEYGHYFYGAGHNFENSLYSWMTRGSLRRGLGLMNSGSGGGLAMNPQEKYLLGYITYTDVFYDQGGTLPDFNSTGTAYRIPIPTHINGQPNTTPDEFFVIANHQKISPYELRKNKGIYIYHIKSNTYRHNHMEMVTADGLWQWKVTKWVTRPAGYGSPADWALNSGFTTTPPDLFPAIGRSWVNRINGLNELQEVTVAKYPIDNNYYYWDRYLDENGNPNDGVIPENSKP